MKAALRLLALAACLLPASPSFAAKFSYHDEENEWFTVNIPATWKPEINDEDKSLEANSPEADAYLAFWVLKNKKEIENIGDDLDELLKDNIKKPKLKDKPLEKTVNGIEFTIFQGSGKDADDGTNVGFEIFLFAPKEGKLGIFYCQYNEDAPADVIQSLIKIVESIQLTKK
jgi:hypothetical protein